MQTAMWCIIKRKATAFVHACVVIDFFQGSYLGAALHILRAGSNNKIVLMNKLVQYGSDNGSTSDNKVLNADILNQCPFW